MNALFLFAVLVLFPLPAFAFGPIAHTDLGLEVIAHAGVLTASIASLIRRRQREFLMGTLDPDRILAKNLAPYPKHTHNWDHAFRLFRQSRDEGERARMLGYICHLAADVVAHNQFVPVKSVESFAFRTARHTFWEMRFDARVRERKGAWPMWGLRFNAPDHRRYLARVLRPSVLGPQLNLRLTGLSMIVQRGALFGYYARGVDRRSRLSFPEREVQEIRGLALRASLSTLESGRGGPVTRLDPRGLGAIRLSHDVGRQLRELESRGSPPADRERIVQDTRRYFEGIVASAL